MTKELIIYTPWMFLSPTIIKILDDIETYKPKKLLLFNPAECTFLGTTNRNEFDELNSLLEKYDIKFYVLIGSETINGYEDVLLGKNIEYLFWPTYQIHRTYNAIKKQLHNFTPKKVETLYSFHNWRPRTHRGFFLEKLFINNLFEYGNITWKVLTRDDSSCSHHEFKVWEETYLTVDIQDDGDTYNIENFHDNSLFHIVGETEIHKNFITEKTYRTIFIEKPFLIFGSKNSNICLKKYGFEIFDELIDYEFDKKENIEERLDGIIDILLKLKNQDFLNLHKSIEDKITHNKNRILEIVKKDEFIPTKLVDLYRQHKKDFNDFFSQKDFDDCVKGILENYG